MERVFFTSDTHFHHENIIRYCDRPFSNATQMNESLICNWNSVIKKKEEVWHLGDFALPCTQEEVKELVNKLNGRINLVKGNHDCHSDKWYRECGFHRVYDRTVLWNDFILLSHKPLEWNDDKGVYGSLYGHIHNNPNYNHCTRTTYNVGVDTNEFTPISWEQIQEKIKNC